MTSCRVLANSLGAYETTLLRMVTGYSEFVNGGKKIAPSLIDRIQDRNGKTIWRHDERKCDGCNDAVWHDQEEPLLTDNREQIIDPRTAFQIVSMLQGVVQRGTAAYSVGAQIDKPAGGGQDRHPRRMPRDTWFIGFSPDLAAGVFVGFDNPHTLGPERTGRHGGGADLPRLHEGSAEGCPADAVPHRAGHRGSAVDWKSGSPVPAGTPGAIMEAFKAGTAPGEANAPRAGRRFPAPARPTPSRAARTDSRTHGQRGYGGYLLN